MKGYRQDLARAKTPAAKLKVFQAISDYLDLQLMENRAAAAVMRMVIKYERSIREARLEEIKGWRKALALGAAGLAGLSPMKAKAAEPVPPTPYTQSVAQTPGEQAPLTSSQATDAMNFLQDLRGATHVQSVDYDDKTDSYTWKGPTTGKQMSMSRTEFNNEIWAPYQATVAMNWLQDKQGAPHVKTVGYEDKTDSYAWRGPTTGKRMTMSRADFDDQVLTPYLKSQQSQSTARQTSSTELDPDIMSKGNEAGKAYAPGSTLSPDEIRAAAKEQAQKAGYTTNDQAQNSFIEGWINGYYEGHNVPGDPERAQTQAPQPTPTPSPQSTQQVADTTTRLH